MKIIALLCALLLIPACAAPRTTAKPNTKAASAKPVAKPTVKKPTPPPGMMVAPFVLPPPVWYTTAYSRGYFPHTTALPPKNRGVIYLPKGASNVAFNKPVTSSDETPRGSFQTSESGSIKIPLTPPLHGTLTLVTDGDKKWEDGSFVELASGTQWVQIDLQNVFTIHGVLLWHYYGLGCLYRDVIIQLADDADFTKNLRTVYNNDDDNSSGLGIGKDREFYESNKGQWIPIAAQRARFVRLYSRGNSRDPLNIYTEVEVWGSPPPGMMVAPFELPPPSYQG